MVAPIYFPVFNSNFHAYSKDLKREDFTPTLHDWLHKYRDSIIGQEHQVKVITKIAIKFLEFLSDICIMCEISINHFIWPMLSREQWLHIHDVCDKLNRKSWEYRYASQQRVESASDTESQSDSDNWSSAKCK